MKRLTFNDCIILVILGLFVMCILLGAGWYHEYKNNKNESYELENQLKEYEIDKIKLSNNIILKEAEIMKINIINDSLNTQITEIDKKRKINYNNYQNELKRNKNIVTIKSANIIVDSILRANNIR